MPEKDSKRRVASASDPVGTFKIIEESLRDLWKVVDDLSRVRPPQRRFYRVTIFGSSRMQPGDTLYEDVRRLAAQLAGIGCDIVTGGGPGLMQAANEGEHLGDKENRTRSYGVSIELPFEEAPNPFVERIYSHRTFFTRLHHFVRLSNAFIVVSGGIGTTLEMLMVWQLCQVRHVYNTPLILVGGMWDELIAWARTHMLDGERSLANPEDMSIPDCVGTLDEAIELIRAHKAEFDAALGAARGE